jgi:hypothetical protein
MNESKFSSDREMPGGDRSRRRFLGRCAGLLGAWGLAVPARAGCSAPATGPRELALREADFYRPHHLAG